jgi:hypothetical protein
MSGYTLREICEIVGIEEGFALELVRESVLVADAAEAAPYSARMLERARVARELVQELEVNLAGAAVIVRLGDLRRYADAMMRELERARSR